MTIIAAIDDFREAARRRLPRFLFDYADGGALGEYTMRRNVADLADLAVRQRVLQAVGRPGWAWDVGLNGRPHQLGNLVPVLGQDSGMNDYIAWMAANFDPGIRWKDLDWLRDAWDGPLIIKGILDPDDARDAAA